MEREAKYRATRQIKPKELEKLDLAPYALDDRITHELRDTLLDTPEQALTSRQYALRVRQDGGKTILTLKAPGEVVGAVHSRRELEAPISAEQHDKPDHWPELIAGPVRELIGDASLAPLIEVRNHRRTWNITREGQQIAELALDRGEIEAAERKTAFHELEIEIKGAGTDDDLAALERLLCAGLPLEPESQSKMARGVALLKRAEQEHDPVLQAAADRTPMRPNAPLAEAGRSILARHLRKLRESIPVIHTGDDSEGVHQLRVATRRMRAVLGALSDVVYDADEVRRLRRGLKQLATAAGSVRDPEVMLDAVHQHAGTLDPGAAAGLNPLYDVLHQRRDEGRTALFALLDRKKTTRFMRRLSRFILTEGVSVKQSDLKEAEAHPTLVRQLAGGLLWRQFEQVRAYETVLPSAPIATLHRLRIEIKYLRYLLELFEDALDDEATTLHKSLVAAQDHLGEMHDAEVAIELIDTLLIDDPDNALLHAYRAQQVSKRDDRVARAPQVAGLLMQLPFRRRLATVIAKL